MKAAPVISEIEKKNNSTQILVHTGQHYDSNMSEVFFKQLGLPEPDINLEVGSGSHAVQKAQIMIKLENVLLEQKPDIVLVYGDVNSTIASALVCAKLLIPVGHVEAGLRSFDKTMPEEINRIVTDQLSELLFTPSKDGNKNLLREGITEEKIFFVGNVMIDTLIRLREIAADKYSLPQISKKYDLSSDMLSNGYGLVTLHRPSNVDDPDMLGKIIKALYELSNDIPIIFPIHPRTRQRLGNSKSKINNSKFILVEPMSYLEFLSLQENASVVITDSGGIQEESTFIGVPCLTLRENTERPVTIDEGTNILVGKDLEKLKAETHQILTGTPKRGSIPQLWDGKASERITDIIMNSI